MSDSAIDFSNPADAKLQGVALGNLGCALGTLGAFGAGASFLMAILSGAQPFSASILLYPGLGLVGVIYLYFSERDRLRHNAAVRDRPRQQAARAQAAREQVQAWRLAKLTHEESERIRVASLPSWGAIVPSPGTRRLDVYGGTDWGWSSLISTFGCSVLADGRSLLVFDLTRGEVAEELCRLAGEKDVDTRIVVLPNELDKVSLGGEVSSGELVEMLLQSFHGESQSDMHRETRAVDDRILRGIADVLGERATTARIAAALKALLSAANKPPVGSPLSEDEYQVIRSLHDMDFLAQVRDRIVSLEAQLHQLRHLEVSGDMNPALLSCYAVTDAATDISGDLIASLLPQLAASALRRSKEQPFDTLIVAGCDVMRRRQIEALSDVCGRRGVQLMLMFRHLRSDSVEVLGGDRSAAVFMRLGNADEAEHAAQFIGKEDRFELTQLTETMSRGETRATGTSQGFGDSVQIGFPGLYSHGSSRQWGTTQQVAREISSQQGTVLGRVNRYAVEPVSLQELPETALLYVELDRSRGGRRFSAADCNPDLALSPGVSMSALG